MCEIGFDGDSCAVWNEEERTARKDHQCDCCRGRIARGQRYIAHASLFDGSWSHAKLCLPCRDTRAQFVSEHSGLIPHPTALEETISECIEWDDVSSTKWGPHLAAMLARREEVARG